MSWKNESIVGCMINDNEFCGGKKCCKWCVRKDK